MPVLESLGTAVPGEPVPQHAVRQVAADVLTAFAPELAEHLSVFETGGVESRHFVRPLEWYLEPHGWADRNAVYAEEGLALLETAAREALDAADVGATDVDGIVFVSTTGIATPSLDARLVNRLGLRPDVQRVPVWGLGCAAGVGGLNLAADLARARPDARYLMLSLELCSLAFHLNDTSMRAFVSTTLFGDGAAAALVRGDALEGPHHGRLRRGATHAWPDSERIMGWEVADEGLLVVLSRSLPGFVQERLAPVVQAYLKREQRTPDRLVFHPGGRKVLEAYQAALGVPAARFDDSREVLRSHGNMSSPTVLFVLERALARAPLREGETALLGAMGPAFAADLGMLEG